MAKKNNTATGETNEVPLLNEDMQRAIPKLQRRLAELESLSVEQLSERGDLRFQEIETKVNQTLIDIFGQKSREYYNFSCHLDTAPYSMAGPIPRQRWVEGYQRGLEKSKSNLNTLIQLLNERISDTHFDPVTRAKKNFSSMDLHPEIVRASAKLFDDGHYANAIEDACKVLDNLVRMRSGIDDKSGTTLMQHVFGTSPSLVFNSLTIESERSEQQGMMFLYSGVMLAFRNPRAHQIVQDDPEAALEMIGFISFLCKNLDRAKKP